MSSLQTTRSIVDFFRDQRNGELDAEASKALQQVIQAVTTQEKKATLTIIIEVEPSKGGGMVVVTDDVKVKLPKQKRGATIFYATPENHLTRQDPRQQQLQLREVGAESTPMKPIGEEAVSNG